jgi:putative copper export protein
LGITRKSIKARFAGVLLAVVAGLLAVAGPASAGPAGLGGGGSVASELPLAPPAAGAATTAGEIYLVLIAVAVVIAMAVLAIAVLGRMRARRAAAA